MISPLPLKTPNPKRFPSMFSTPRHLRRPLIALVAIFAASFAAGDAAACSTMKPGQGACQTACGCCKSEAGEASSTHTLVATHATVPVMPRVAHSAPAEGCSCRSQAPAAPTPKPAQSTPEGRPKPSYISEFVHFGEAFAARLVLVPQVPATQSPPKAPLYLRNERLLF